MGFKPKYNRMARLDLERNLTPLEFRFCREYIIDLNGTAAVKRSHVPIPKYPEQVASQILKRKQVQDYLQFLESNLSEATHMTAVAVVEELKKVAFSNPDNYLTVKDGTTNILEVKPWNEIDCGAKAAISEIESDSITKQDNNKDGFVTFGKAKIKLHDKLKALDQLVRMFGWNSPEKMIQKIESGGMTPFAERQDFSESTDDELRTILKMNPDTAGKLGISETVRNSMQRELNNRSFYEFFLHFWDCISQEEYKDNWHVEFLCNEAQEIAERVGAGEAKEHDLLINIPPGTSKTSILSIMFVAWCWTRWFWMKFITASYSQSLALESSETCRDLIRSDKFKALYPDIMIKQDKDTKSNYKIVKRSMVGGMEKFQIGGGRYTTSVGGSVTGFHCHIFIWDDPLNPKASNSDVELYNVNRWIDQIISTRKIDKEISTTIGIMQRLHQNDPSGHLLDKNKSNLKHICLPGELDNYKYKLTPVSLEKHYTDGLLDATRLNRKALKELETDLGQYGYSGQIGQDPVPPGGGMFKVDNLTIVNSVPSVHEITKVVRYWDKAGSDGKGAHTAGVKIASLKNGKFLVLDVVRGQWASEKREAIIKQTTEADGLCEFESQKGFEVWVEQEPGSGGKESADATIKNLAGYVCRKDLPKGDKALRADPLSVQVNNGNVLLLRGAWNKEFIEEFRYFPFSKYKDQVDAASAGFSKLTTRKIARGRR